MKTILEPIIDQYYEEVDTEFFSELPKTIDIYDGKTVDINSVFSIEPYSGVLLPYEYILANVAFNPPPNAMVKAVVLCNVEGGETERMVLRGASAKVMYKFDKDRIDFRRKVSNQISHDIFFALKYFAIKKWKTKFSQMG